MGVPEELEQFWVRAEQIELIEGVPGITKFRLDWPKAKVRFVGHFLNKMGKR